MQSWTKPTAELVDGALDRLQHHHVRRYFFERLENPHWISALAESGLFDDPPSPLADPASGAVSFPNWPQSRYLARVAKHAPEDAVNAIQRVPMTDNLSISRDFLEAALAVPSSLARPLASVAVHALQDPFAVRMLGDEAVQLAASMAESGFEKEAREICRLLFSVFPAGGISQSVKANIDPYNFNQLLGQFVELAGLGHPSVVVRVLCNQLRDAIEATSRGRHEGLEDNSNLWAPSLDELDAAGDVRESLAASLESFCIGAIAGGKLTLDETLEHLERHQRSIFVRIAMRLAGRHAGSQPDAATKLLDVANFDIPELHREYRALLKVAYQHIPGELRSEIRRRIEQGPNLDSWTQAHREITGQDISEDRLNARVDRWRFENLHPIQQYLSADDREEFDRLASSVDAPPSYESPSAPVVSWRGPQTPITESEIAGMEDDQLIAFLTTWTPPEVDFLATYRPSRTGVGQSLAAAIGQDPERFAGLAPRFAGLHHAYVRSAFDGFCQALRSSESFPLAPVLELGRWLLEQDRSFDHEEQEFPGDELDYGVGRLELARLLESALQSKSLDLELTHREEVWELISKLAMDPDPNDPPSQDSRARDSSTHSLNCIRGVALHAAVAYGLWLHRMLGTEAGAVSTSFSAFPELRQLLDKHLSVEQDPSLAIRSVFGRWFPWLTLLDADWARENAERIFPESTDYWRVAWSAYVTLCQPYNDVLAILRDQYSRAVRQVGDWTDEGRTASEADRLLAQHLLTFFIRGLIDLRDPLLVKFWERASENLRQDGLWFCGQFLHRPEGEEPLPVEMIRRLVVLWEDVRARAEADEEVVARELRAFSYWFSAGELDPQWALDQLEFSARVAGEIELEGPLMEKLASLASDFPLEALNALEWVARADQWGAVRRSQELAQILSVARSSGFADRANAIADSLARNLGWTELVE